jgi:hypothetical protein
MNLAVPILISARNRPLYLWATLDNLYRTTRYPHQFTLLDVASTDPLVRDVVKGFERRGMFKGIVWSGHNQPEAVWNAVVQLIAGEVPYLGYVESDVLIEPTSPCWLERFVALMERNPKLAMLSAAIDRQDFVDIETARWLEPHLPEPQFRALIKADSPERLQDVTDARGAELFSPHNPPGRLLLLRTRALREIGPASDGQLHEKFIAAGYETAVATTVRHRHLSLLHIFDYPGYDTKGRDHYVRSIDTISNDACANSQVRR